MRKKFNKSEVIFNLAALFSLVASITIWFSGERDAAIFVGLWVPSIIGWMNFFKLKEQESQQLKNETGR